MDTGVLDGKDTPSNAQYNSRNKSGLLNRVVKTLSLKRLFIIIYTSKKNLYPYMGATMHGALSKTKNSTPEFVSEITGLSMEEIAKLKKRKKIKFCRCLAMSAVFFAIEPYFSKNNIHY